MKVRNRWLRVVVALSTVAMIAFNVFANVLPLAGRSTGGISDAYPVRFTPAGYVFAIWGLIYLAMLAYSAAQFIRPLAEDDLPDLLAAPVIAANAFNVMWLWQWHNLRFASTVVLMVGLLVSLAVAYQTSRRGRRRPSPLERWAVRATFSLYLGWISVALIANVSVWLYSLGWRGGFMSEEAWAVALIGVAVALAALMLWRERDLVFAGVVVWALVGIAVKQADAQPVVLAGYGGAVAIAAGMAVTAVLLKRDKRPPLRVV